MFFVDWLRIVRHWAGKTTRKSRRNRRQRHERHQSTSHLLLERLEDRFAPAVYDYAGSTLKGTFTTVQPAVDAAATGDTIKIDEGTYSDVTIDKSLTLQGTNATATSFTLESGESLAGSSGITAQTVNVSAGAKIQDGILLASSGGTVNVAAGLYQERIAITKPLTLLGATADVNKNGYTVPVNYAWAGESVISNPSPEPDAGRRSCGYPRSDVTFKGFVVESLNAPPSSANDQLLRVDAQGGTRNNVVVENNVIGPNTNVTSQNGTNGRMGLYLSTPTYPGQGVGITNSTFAHNKIFGTEGNGNTVFVWRWPHPIVRRPTLITPAR